MRGCGRWTRAGEVFCGRHGADDSRAVATETDDDEARGFAAFRVRLAAGDYDAVLRPGLRGTLQGAAADTGLEAETGALRLALIRLLEEERDPSRLAAGVSRVAGVAVQAARLRQSGGADAEEPRAALLRALAVFEAEQHEGGEEVSLRSGGEG